LLHIWWCARLSIHSSFQTVKLDNRVQRTNAYSVKKIYLFIENNDHYGRKKYFSTVVLLYDGRIFIDILKNQPPNVNSYRKVLQTCSKALWPCRWKKIQFKWNQHYSSSSLSMNIGTQSVQELFFWWAFVKLFAVMIWLRWLITVSRTFQEVDFDGSLLPLKILLSHRWTRWYHFHDTIGYHSNTMTR